MLRKNSLMPDLTLTDVARAARTSVATASRALAGRGDLAAETRARVLEAAARLGYHRAPGARGRPSMDPRSIELVMGRFHDDWADEIVVGAQRAAAAVGCDLVLTVEREDPADDWPQRVATRRSSGVVLGIIVPTATQLAALRRFNIPVVLLDPRGETTRGLPSVGTTDRLGGADAAAHLMSCGYVRFAVLAPRPRYRFGRERERGFRETLERHGLGDRLSVIESPSQLPALAGTGRLGIFAVTDQLAVRAIDAAASAGLSVPDRVGVVGFDDGGLAQRRDLTTIHQPLRAMAAQAVDMVHLHRGMPAPPSGRIELPSRVVVRSTTSPA